MNYGRAAVILLPLHHTLYDQSSKITIAFFLLHHLLHLTPLIILQDNNIKLRMITNIIKDSVGKILYKMQVKKNWTRGDKENKYNKQCHIIKLKD